MKVKHLAIGVGILLVLAAAGVAMQHFPGTSSNGDPHIGKPLLAAVDMEKATRIELVGAKTTTTLVTTPAGWVVQEQGDFPADQGKLSSFLFKLNSEKPSYKVSEDAGKLGELSLLTQEENGGKLEEHKTGVLFSIKESGGKPLYQLLIGRDREATTTTSAFGGQYVRIPGEKAAYLIGTTLFAETDSKEWIQKQIQPEDANKQFRRMVVTREPKAKPLVFLREKADSPWQLEGATVRGLNTKEIDNLAKRVSDLEAVQLAKADAQPAALGRGKLGSVEVETFDGKRYRYEIGETKAPDSYRYISVAASLDNGVKDEAAKKSVADFNSRYHNRLLAVYDWDATRLLKDRKDYIEAAKPGPDK